MKQKRIIYCHGQPGWLHEIDICPDFANAYSHSISVLRRSDDPALSFSEFMDQQAEALNDLIPKHEIHIVGFSVGGFVAIELAARLGENVARLDLVSAAAPLETGDYLDKMAGGPVFKEAINNFAGFRRLTGFQAFLARRIPSLLHHAIFRSAAGQDRDLNAQLSFRGHRKADFAHSLGKKGRIGYERDVLAYVKPWKESCAKVTAPTHIWHGDQDNWAPPKMADALADLLPNVVSKTMLEGASHYSALQHALQTLVPDDHVELNARFK